MVEHRVSKSHREWLNNPIFFALDVVKQLKGKGVPVVGHSVLEGVEHGYLEITSDQATQEWVYRWHPPVGYKAKPTKAIDPLNDDEDEEL